MTTGKLVDLLESHLTPPSAIHTHHRHHHPGTGQVPPSWGSHGGEMSSVCQVLSTEKEVGKRHLAYVHCCSCDQLAPHSGALISMSLSFFVCRMGTLMSIFQCPAEG